MSLSFKIYFCFYSVLFLWNIAFSQQEENQKTNNFEIELAFPHIEKDPVLDLKFSYLQNQARIKIKNGIDSVVRFFENWNSWGYFNTSFEIVTADSTYEMFREERDFTKNYPSYITLHPGDSMILYYYLSDCKCFWREFKVAAKDTFNCLAWEGGPEKNYDSATIKVVYKLAKGNLDTVPLDFFSDDFQTAISIQKNFCISKLVSKEYHIKIKCGTIKNK